MQTRQPRRAHAATSSQRAHQQLGWTLEEAQRFLAAVGDHRLAAAFHVSLVSGLRRGELLALRWTDVDLKARQLTIHQQLAIERGRPTIKQLKTEHADPVVAFGPRTAAVLKAHRTQQESERRFVDTAGRTPASCSPPPLAVGHPHGHQAAPPGRHAHRQGVRPPKDRQ